MTVGGEIFLPVKISISAEYWPRPGGCGFIEDEHGWTIISTEELEILDIIDHLTEASKGHGETREDVPSAKSLGWRGGGGGGDGGRGRLRDNVKLLPLSEGKYGEVGAVDKHGGTASLRVNTDTRTMVAVHKTTLRNETRL